MKAKASLWVCLFFGNFLCAQKYDYVWLTGYSYGYDTISQHWYGATKFDFNQQPAVITRDSLGINFNRCIQSISDYDGNLLFYSNGIKVNNYLDELIPNGDSIGWSTLFSVFASYQYQQGHADNDIFITLPNPLHDKVFDFFYGVIDTINLTVGLGLECKKIERTTVDMNGNGGKGTIIKKDEIILSHNTTSSITAVRHANGRDWWICTGRQDTNCYDLMLYDGSDSLKKFVQCGGADMVYGRIFGHRFSPDGSTFMMVSSQGCGSVFDFDRCNGTMNLRESFGPGVLADSVHSNPGGLEFSPDSRFAYVFCGTKTIQLDLHATPILSSRDTVDTYTGFNTPYPVISSYGQLAPDGKIYIATEGSNYYGSVIDNPNGKGAACNFMPHGIELPTWFIGLPYYPNYRLGALTGSACDTLTGLNDNLRAEKEKVLKVYPNPATNYVVVDYGFTDWNKGEVSLEISNELGQAMYVQKVPMYSGFQKINTTLFATGMYNVYIKRNGAVVAVAKFAKE